MLAALPRSIQLPPWIKFVSSAVEYPQVVNYNAVNMNHRLLQYDNEVVLYLSLDFSLIKLCFRCLKDSVRL